MMQSREKRDYKLRALKLSTLAISSVVFVEGFVGLAVNSLAILSDGLHALLDALTMFGLLVATRFSLKPPDEEHMYGHEKFESLGGLMGGLVLIGTALWLMNQSVIKIVGNGSQIKLDLELVGFAAIGYTFCMDFFRVGTLRKAIEGESTTMKAGLYHAIADLGSTIIALAGFGLATLGFYRGDFIASMVLSVLLVYLSLRLVWNSGMELSDAISRDVASRVRKEILSTRGVCKCENLRVRKAGAKTFVEATVKVPEQMNLEEAHALASRMETNIKNLLGNADITIHMEPMRTEMQTEKRVERLAAEVEGVKETHRITAVYSDGKLYITLHARVDPHLPVHEAHEIAERIESKIAERISEVENVTVHIEPLSTEALKGSQVDENEIRRIISETREDYRRALRIKRIVTYVADNKRYINIDCGFTSPISIKDAHKIASQIERRIRKQFVETVVTVHIEPDVTT